MTYGLEVRGRPGSGLPFGMRVAVVLAWAGMTAGCSSSSDAGSTSSAEDAGATADAHADVSSLPACSTPQFDPPSGLIVAGTDVVLTAPGLPSDGYIFFTTDGTYPNATSSNVYTGGTVGMQVNGSETIHAIAYAAGACSPSPLASATYAVQVDADAGAEVDASVDAEVDAGLDARSTDAPVLPACAAPEFNPPPGTVDAGTHVVLTAPGLPSDGFIFFTTDGTYPNSRSSLAYTDGTTGMQVNASETIHAIAYAAGSCSPSPLASATYLVGQSVPGTPILTPAGGTTSTNDQSVTMTSAGAATVCYTLDGTTPSCTQGGDCAVGALYDSSFGGIALPPPGSSSTTGGYTLSAIGCAPGGSSPVETQNYAMAVAAPTSSRASGSATWTLGLATTLSTTTSGATVYFSYGGTPACGFNPAPAGGVTPLQSGTLAAIACKPGYSPSVVVASAYIVTLNAPTLTPATTTGAASFSVTASDTLNAGSGDWVCYSSGVSGSIAVPACGSSAGICAAGSLLVTSAGAATIGVGASGSEVEAIACAPAGLTSSATAMGGPYTLKLSAPYALPVGSGSAPPGSTQYTLTGVGPVVIGQTDTYANPAAQEASFACYVQDPVAGHVAACGGDGVTCAAGATKATLGADGGYWDTGAGGLGAFAPGDSLSMVLCPGASGGSAHYLASDPATVQFVGSAQAMAVTLGNTTSTASTYGSPVAPILVNVNAGAVTACFTVDGTTPTCLAGTCTGATTSSLALDGAASQNHALAIGTAIENNGASVRVVACSASLSSSPLAVFTYANSFVLATPTVSVPAGFITSATTLTLSTTSTFSDTTIAYAFDGSPPDCAGVSSTIIHGASGAVSPSDYPPMYFPVHLLAVACAGTAATNQTTSTVIDFGAYTVTP